MSVVARALAQTYGAAAMVAAGNAAAPTDTFAGRATTVSPSHGRTPNNYCPWPHKVVSVAELTFLVSLAEGVFK